MLYCGLTAELISWLRELIVATTYIQIFDSATYPAPPALL